MQVAWSLFVVTLCLSGPILALVGWLYRSGHWKNEATRLVLCLLGGLILAPTVWDPWLKGNFVDAAATPLFTGIAGLSNLRTLSCTGWRQFALLLLLREDFGGGGGA